MSNNVLKTILAIDYGSKRVGVALKAANSSIIIPMYSINNSFAENEILQIITDKSVDLVVFGIPNDMNGNETKSSQKVRTFARRIKRRASIEVHFQDEFLSTFEVRENARQRKSKINEKDGSLDALSAAEILRVFIES